MKPSPPRRSRTRRLLVSLGTAAGCAAIPKCLGCFVAYLGLGAALGLRPGIEVCGVASAGASGLAIAVAVPMGVIGAVVAFRR